MIYEGTPYPQFRLKVLLADLIRSSPHFTGAGQEALHLADAILNFLSDSGSRPSGENSEAG